MAEKKRGRKFRSKALEYAYDRYVGEDSERGQSFEDELLNARIACQIYDLRTKDADRYYVANLAIALGRSS